MMYDEQTGYSGLTEGLLATASVVMSIRVLVLAAAVAAAVVTLAPQARAQAGIPMCNDVVNDPTIATCTCTCESSSEFNGCQGKSEGDSAPTPGQCPDMLQGRRVLSRGDWLIAADPVRSSSTTTQTRRLYFQSQNDSSNAGLGVVAGTPAFTLQETVQCTTSDPTGGRPFPMQTRFARLFDLPYDMAVTARPPTTGTDANCDSTGNDLVIHVHSPNSGAPTVPDFTENVNSRWMQLAIDDFDYDGFDDILLLTINFIRTYTAVDPSDPSKGLTHTSSVSTETSSGAYRAPINAPTTGDFNGDGLIDVAWIGGDFPHNAGTLSVFFATVCPADTPGTVCAGAQPFQIILDPASRQFSGGQSTIVLSNASLTKTACGVVQQPNNPAQPIQADSLRAGTVVMGNFEDNGFNPRGAPIDELIVAYVSGTDGIAGDLCSTDVQYWSYSIPTSSEPLWARQRGAPITNILPGANARKTINGIQYKPIINLYSQAAYLDWYGQLEQAVIAVSGAHFFQGSCGNTSCDVEGGSFWYPVTVSVTGTGDGAQADACGVTTGGGEGDRESPLVWGLAVGRFSTSTTVNPDTDACADFSSAAPGDCPYNPQIALLVAGNTGNTAKPTSIRLYNVEETAQCAFAPQVYKTIDIGGYTDLDIVEIRAGGRLQAADVVGNSVRVGTPWVTRTDVHTQPQLVIQAPPSLIDYVNPTTSPAGEPAIVNFSRAPGQFNAQFSFTSSSTTTATASHVTSYSMSTVETQSGTLKFPMSALASLTVKNTETEKQFHSHSVAHNLSDYATKSMMTGGQIGADDQVWWTQTTFNVFHFPVLGQTACPATVTCDASDPNTTGCSAAADGVELTCSAVSDGCECLSQGATASLCPAVPGSGLDVRLSCSTSSDNVCCTQRQEQLYMSFSGPEEVTRSTAPGSLLEWYQPLHEPGQILSYPSTNALLQARTSGFDSLAAFDDFSTGTNSSFETFTWECGSTRENSIAKSQSHSFETDTSVTWGTNDLAKQPGGFEVSAGFDYQNSTSTQTLNSSTMGQSTASSVTLNLEPEAFYSTDQFAYSLHGALFGVGVPGVLDHPDLDVNGQPPDCTTTGPLTVAFAANPAGSTPGRWWQSDPPYLQYVDVALNNPSRWSKVEASDVADTALQCRGPSNGLACYTINQPSTDTDAASVWDADFYDMKGLLVTTGALGGPQRTTAKVGDQVFLQLRVYNYSLAAITEKVLGSAVYARIYRQKLDVNEIGDTVSVLRYATDASGQPLPAVPIGPAGLGDPTPLTVFSPLGEATVNKFNVSSDPRLDNISLATTSYIVPPGDECDEESCDGAYYAYWATVWVEDASGNVVGELPGHGLGAFDRNRSYEFITDVPLETVSFDGRPTTFSNNVGMYKQVFAIVPADTALTLDATGPGKPRIFSLQVSSKRTVVGRPVVVSAQVASLDAATLGATMIFTDGDPDNGGTVFDVEMLPHIRANDVHTAQVHYTPTSCGPHRLFVDVTARGFADRQSVSLTVPCKGDKVPICHKGKNLSVSGAALKAHLGHGDTLGACGN